MIPFLLVAAGGFLVGRSLSTPKYGLGDIVESPKVSEGDEVVFQFHDDTWVEFFDDKDDLLSEEFFPGGEMFEVIVNAMTGGFFYVTFPDNTKAALRMSDVEVVAVNDEVFSFANGGDVKELKAKIKERLRMMDWERRMKRYHDFSEKSKYQVNGYYIYTEENPELQYNAAAPRYVGFIPDYGEDYGYVSYSDDKEQAALEAKEYFEDLLESGKLEVNYWIDRRRKKKKS